MNYKLIAKILGLLLLLLAASMAACDFYAWLLPEKREGYALLTSTILTAVFGGILTLIGRGSGRDILRKEAIAIVGLGWTFAGVMGAIPYVLCKPGLSFCKAFFESVSGFTTTGSTVIADLTLFPKDILLWRAMTQWLGGMGILVLFVALLSYLGVGSKSLFRHESSAQIGYGFYAKIRQTALRLWQIYLTLSAICFLGLIVLGVPRFDALLHTFAAISTGGFSPHNASVAEYNSAAVDAWLTIIMFFGGMNFVLIAWLIRGHVRRFFKDEEFRIYFLILLLATLAIAANLVLTGSELDVGKALQYSSFQVVSIMTTTGFVTADFDQWPTFSKMLLAVLMIIGGSTGSTAGGIKVNRVILFAKACGQQLINAFRPTQVIRVRMNGEAVAEEEKNQAIFFIALIFGIICISAVVIGLIETKLSMMSVLGSILATLFNIGPGFEAVGATMNFSQIGDVALLLLSALMMLGRLELFAVLVLFVPALWKRY